MAIRFRCPACEELLSGQEDMVGALIVCPLCSAQVEVPPVHAAVAAPVPAAPAEQKQAAPAAPSSAASPGPGAKTDPADASRGYASPVAFTMKEREQDDLDMTPMVDVTFLLLIFFMITAAFSLQKAFETPAPDESEPSTQSRPLDELEDDPKFVVVRIDQYNTFHVSGAACRTSRRLPASPTCSTSFASPGQAAPAASRRRTCW